MTSSPPPWALNFDEWASASMMAAMETHVKQHLHDMQVDASHDWGHIDRVRFTAGQLVRQEHSMLPEGLREQLKRTVELCALLHDVADWKYSGSESAGVATVSKMLADEGAGKALSALVCDVVSRIGFKESLARNGRSALGTQSLNDVVLALVQDADRLDAIGAIGIARCFTFGGRFNRVLHDPEVEPRVGLTKAEYMSSQQQTTINHFHEKLFLLQGLMNTKHAKAMAQRRTKFMEKFLQQFYAEWEGFA